jgi:multidrug efflux pump
MINVWNFFLKKSSFAFLLMFSLLIAGIFSAIVIPKESAPEVIVPVGIVTTILRGGSAEDVEKLVSKKLETEIKNVENIDKVTSSSRDGLSVISAQFLANADVDESIQALKDAVDKVKNTLPADAEDPNVSKVNFADQPVLVVSISQDISPKEFTSLSKKIKEEIEKINGVSKVEITGVRKKEVQVLLRSEQLAKYKVSADEVIRAIQLSNAEMPIGKISIDNIDYPIKLSGSINQGVEVKDISFRINNEVIYLRDLGEVYDTLENSKTFSRISDNGEPSQNAMTLFIYKKSGGDVSKVTQAVNQKIEDLKSSLLLDAQVVNTIDAGKDVKKDLNNLSVSGLQTVILVVLILFIAIGWREALVAGLSIPLSFLIAFIGLLASGNTINFLSLFSLILAVGILVDSGIVVSEAISSKIEEGKSSYVAAKDVIQEYSWPLISGTMTTVAVFAPLLFLSGITGQFVKSIPFTLVFVLLSSIFVSLAFVPVIATLIIKKRDKENFFSIKRDYYFEKTNNWYRNFLTNFLTSSKKQKKFFLSLVMLGVISLALTFSGMIKVELFPQEDINFLVISVENSEGTVLNKTDIITRQIEDLLYNNVNVQSFVTTVGASSGLLDNGGGGQNSKFANITVLLKEDRDLNSTEILEMFRKDLFVIKDAKVKIGQPNNGPPGGKPIVIKFLGENLDELGLAAENAEKLLSDINGTVDIETSLNSNATQFEITVDKEKASSYGINPVSVANLLRVAVSGQIASEIKTENDDVDILVKYALNPNFITGEDVTNATIESIKKLTIKTNAGDISLSSIVDIKLSEARSVITREDGKRAVTVSSGLKEGFTSTEIVTKLKERESELKLPATVVINYGGETEDIDNTFRDMLIALVTGLLLMLAILVIEFNSIRYSLYLLSSVPLGLIGILIGLFISGQALSFTSMLGIVSMAGIVVNNAIILLDSMINKLDAQESILTKKDNLFNIVIESCVARLRPIFLTTITTVIGMIPLMTVSALWSPFAVTIMAGLTFSTVLTLVMIPIIFYKRFLKEINNEIEKNELLK